MRIFIAVATFLIAALTVPHEAWALTAEEAIDVGSPTPVGDPGEWITPDDYPDSALRDEETGVVVLKLDVSARGQPTQCSITESSGSDLLDTTACDRLMERARFYPVRDADGEAVASTWQNRVVWVVPPRDPAPPVGYFVMSMIVETDGRITDCKVERAEGAEPPGNAEFCDTASGFEPITDANGAPVRRRVRMMYRVTHEPLPE